MDEENFDLKELKEKVLDELKEENYNIFSVKDTLEYAKNRDESLKENFKQTWENYNVVEGVRKSYIRKLYLTRLQLFYIFFIPSIINNDVGIEVDRLLNSIKKSSLEIKEEKVIILLIKKALKELEKNKISDCNYDICELLELLYDKENTLFNEVVRNIQRTNVKVRRINYIPSTANENHLKELNDKIDLYVKELELK